MTKLTEPQRRTLAEIDEAGANGLHSPRIPRAMRKRLSEYRLIELVRRGLGYMAWRLTDAGREALKSGER